MKRMKQVYKRMLLLTAVVLAGSGISTGVLAQKAQRFTSSSLTDGSDVKEFATYDGQLYFSSKNTIEGFGIIPRTDGAELFATDGTSEGTRLVKNINPAVGTGTPVPGVGSDPRELTVFNGRLYFSATSASGRELWVTNGTEGGTELLKDLVPGLGSGDPKELTVCNGRLYFTAISSSNSNSPHELWFTDGTPEGTQRVSDALGVSTGGAEPTELTCSGDKLYYRFSHGFNDLWVTNGTAANTRLVRGGPSNPTAPLGSQVPYFISLSRLTPLNDGRIVFRGNSQASEDEPWVSDGTSEGTFSLDISPGPVASFPGPDFGVYQGRVYFYATQYQGGLDGSNLSGLFATDGTKAGTVFIKNVPNATDFTEFNGRLFFFSGNQLWSTSGTKGSTLTIRDLPAQGTTLTVAGNRLYFRVPPTFSSTSGRLWTSTGTPNGTIPVIDNADNFSDFGLANSRNLVTLNDRLLLVASTTFTNGSELWRFNSATLLPVAPAIANTTGTVGQGFWQVIPSFGNPGGSVLSYSVTGLPTGLSFDGGSGGIIAGNPLVAGVFSVTVVASNLIGESASAVYTLTINPAAGSSPLQLLPPTYSCQTGAIALNATGGNGTPIIFNVPGVQRSDLSATTGVVEAGLRGDPKPILIQAFQGTTTASYTFDLPNACPNGSPGALQVMVSAYNCQTGDLALTTTGGNGTPITFNVPGVQRSDLSATTGVVEAGLRGDPKPILIQAFQGSTMATYLWDLKAACGQARQGVFELTDALTVRVLGNPTADETATVEIAGAAGQSLRLIVSDLQGRRVSEQGVGQAAALETRTVQLSRTAGVYLLRVLTPTQAKTVKIIRP